MSQKQCLKCGHSVSYQDAPPTACPQCGAVYSKVEAAFAPPAPATVAAREEARASTFGRNQRLLDDDIDVHDYASQMRRNSLYPMWRLLVNIATYAAYAIAAIIAIGAILNDDVGPMVTWGLTLFAALIAVFAKVMKELSLILADMSDATVRMAARGEQTH